jgi:hypothetical protein
MKMNYNKNNKNIPTAHETSMMSHRLVLLFLFSVLATIIDPCEQSLAVGDGFVGGCATPASHLMSLREEALLAHGGALPHLLPDG